MIKEIVDIGRVSNKLGSVFTFKGLPEYYVEIVLEWDGKDFNFTSHFKPKEIDNKEMYLQYGIFRGKSGSNIYILPSSFILNLTCDYSKLLELKNQLEEIDDEKNYKRIANQYTTENKKFKADKDAFEKQITSGKKVLDKFFKEYKKEGLRYCKHTISDLLDKGNFKTKKEKSEYKKILTAECEKKYQKNEKLQLSSYLEKILNLLLNNSTQIIEIADSCKKYITEQDKNEKTDNIPIVLKIENTMSGNKYFIHEKYFILSLYKKIIFDNSAQKLVDNEKHHEGTCNIYNMQEPLYFPQSSFYYPYSLDKVNVYPNLNKNETSKILNLSKQAYQDFIVGKSFLETYNSFYFMRLNCYITATSMKDEILKNFQDEVKESKSSLEDLVNLVNKNISNRVDILLNFYFFEPTKTGNNVIEYIKDIIPSQLVKIIKFSNSLSDFYKEKFNREKFHFSWQQHIYSIYHKDAHKKFRTSLFRKIALNDRIDLNRLIVAMNENMQYSINKKEDSKERYYNGTVIKHLMFLDWLNRINKGEIVMSRVSKDERDNEFFVGKTYEERLGYFLDNGNLVKESHSMKIGVCIGLSLQILSWSINGYDKKTLSFVGKRIERNNLSSVQAFVNEIFAKTKFHEYEGLQRTNIRFATQEMLALSNHSFNKDEFIFGLFLGNELYPNVKSNNDPEILKDDEKEIENEKSSTGEENE